jgi:transcriptional regulator with XRE-family HTH domain
MPDERYEKPMTLAERLSATMRERGHDQNAAAAAVPISQTRISKWLSGDAPGRGAYRGLANYLGISVEEVAVLAHRAKEARENIEARLAALEDEMRELRTLVRAAVESALDDEHDTARR